MSYTCELKKSVNQAATMKRIKEAHPLISETGQGLVANVLRDAKIPANSDASSWAKYFSSLFAKNDLFAPGRTKADCAKIAETDKKIGLDPDRMEYYLQLTSKIHCTDDHGRLLEKRFKDVGTALSLALSAVAVAAMQTVGRKLTYRANALAGGALYLLALDAGEKGNKKVMTFFKAMGDLHYNLSLQAYTGGTPKEFVAPVVKSFKTMWCQEDIALAFLDHQRFSAEWMISRGSKHTLSPKKTTEICIRYASLFYHRRSKGRQAFEAIRCINDDALKPGYANCLRLVNRYSTYSECLKLPKLPRTSQ